MMLARAAVRRLEDRWEVGALGQPRLPRCARDPLEGAAVPRSRARSLAPPKPRIPASRSPGRCGAGRSGAASGFSSHRRRGSGGGGWEIGVRRDSGGFGFRNLGNVVNKREREVCEEAVVGRGQAVLRGSGWGTASGGQSRGTALICKAAPLVALGPHLSLQPFPL